MEERFEKVTGFAPYNSHSFSLPSLSSTLPLFDEIRKRSAQFTTLVQSVVLHSITEMCYNSFVLRNMCIFSKMFNWRDSDFICGRVSMSQQYFIKCHRHRLSDVQKSMISLLFELIRLGDNYLVFSGDFNFNHSGIIPFKVTASHVQKW